MKQLSIILLLASCVTITVNAQELPANPIPSNEVKFNIMNTIVLGSLELGYEHFIDQNQSIGAEIHLFDRFAYVSDQREGRSFDATSYLLGFNYYFVSPNRPSGFYVSPFVKYRTGTFTEVGENSQSIETELNTFIIGMGGGYKWVHNDKFALGPYVNIGRGFNEEASQRFRPVEFKAGFSIGFRF
ncbi:DUF3575 domain-containing protein [Lunatibacter salilacus]|uniref:DUF3575 domain-containing protein n=1 Tax=Lunatibacter salilacus TaxID=2483804 RepID=UPI00131BEF8A|nr:DUF3575 domain-containing protein [Lunatibacter salilacus]